MFVNRETELAWLEEGWESQGAELRILYGRRRVGKSALLDAFAQGKRHITYQAVEGSIADQLRDLTAAILAVEDDAVLRAAPLANWEAALAQIAKLGSERPLLFVFDEYQYAGGGFDSGQPLAAMVVPRSEQPSSLRCPVRKLCPLLREQCPYGTGVRQKHWGPPTPTAGVSPSGCVLSSMVA